MIKVWKTFLYPNTLEVRDKDIEELEQLSKQELQKIQAFILKFKGPSLMALPSFNASLIKKFILEGNTLSDMRSFASKEHLNLNVFSVTHHKNLREIHLVSAPKLQKLVIKQNKDSILLNVEKFSSYTELKQLSIESVTFDYKFSEKQLIQMDQKNEQKISIWQILEQNKKMDQTITKFQLGKSQLEQEAENVDNSGQLYSSKAIFQHNNILFLPLLNLKYITELICSNNFIQSIDWFSKGHYPTLSIISLEQNQISTLPKLDIPSCTVLNLSKNVIKTADDFFSSTYPNLFSLNMKENCIQQITQINCPSLAELNLQNNRLRSVPFLNTPQLLALYLNQNQLIETSGLENDGIALYHLELNNNKLRSVPKINPSKIHTLDISKNTIVDFSHFSQLQFPKLKHLLIIMQQYFHQNQTNEKIKLPQFKMPDLQVLNLQWTCFDDLSQFFQGTYNSLTHFDMGTCKTCKKLPKLSMPNLQTLEIQYTLVQDITQFSQGHYPKLAKFQWPYQIIIMKGKGPHSIVQQLCLENSKSQRIMLTNFPSDSKFFSSNKRFNMIELKIDLMQVKNSEFITFINLQWTRSISFQKCSNVNGLMKNLCKINFYQLPDFVKISLQSIAEVIKLSAFQFPYFINSWSLRKQTSYKRFMLGSNVGWRRAFRQENPLQWCINEFQERRRFDLLLPGKKHKKILEWCKEMSLHKYRPQVVQSYK